MTEQKLRKFKLIDREGYLKANSVNERFLDEFFFEGTVTGVINSKGDMLNSRWDYLINADELKFFEEVFEEEDRLTLKQEEQAWDGEYCLEGQQEWFKYKTTYKVDGNRRFAICLVPPANSGKPFEQYLDPSTKFRPLAPKSWQEQLCEEFADFDTELDTVSYRGSMAKEDLILFSKRVLELSGEKG